MVNRRPTPERLATLKIEIDQRYRRQAREAASRQPERRSRGMAAIRLAELTRWMADVYGAGVELEPDDYLVVRIFAHHIGALKDAPRRIDKWVSIYAPWISPRDLERLINEVSECPIKWGADKLGWKIKLTDEQRTKLSITSIGGVDCNKAQRAARRNRIKAERERARRAAKRVSTI